MDSAGHHDENCPLNTITQTNQAENPFISEGYKKAVDKATQSFPEVGEAPPMPPVKPPKESKQEWATHALIIDGTDDIAYDENGIDTWIKADEKGTIRYIGKTRGALVKTDREKLIELFDSLMITYGVATFAEMLQPVTSRVRVDCAFVESPEKSPIAMAFHFDENGKFVSCGAYE